MNVERTPTGHQPPREPVPSPVETAYRTRGLQAWMADIDRRLAIRTKLLLILAAVAIGAAGAAIFLAVEANRTSASQEQLNELTAEVELLREQIELIPGVGVIDAATEEAEDAALEADQAAEDAAEAEAGAEDAAGDAEATEGDLDAAGDALDDLGPPMPEIGTNGR